MMFTVTFYSENVATDERTQAETQTDVQPVLDRERERGRETGLAGVTNDRHRLTTT